MGFSEDVLEMLSRYTVNQLLWVTVGIPRYNSHGLGVGGEI